MTFDQYFSKYLDNKQIHIDCKDNLKKVKLMNLKFTFFLRKYGIYFAQPKICFSCHKTYLMVNNIIENNIDKFTILIMDYYAQSI